MAIKKYNPITPSSRFLQTIDRAGIWKGGPVKTLVKKLNSSVGRNSHGRVTVRGRSGNLNNRIYRLVDFKRDRYDDVATVERLEYDPNRTCFIALIKYESDSLLSYIIAPEKLATGDRVVSSKSLVDVSVGNVMPLSAMPLGTIVHNLDGKLVRSAGSGAQLISKDGRYATLRLPSGEVKMFLIETMASIGVVSNLDNKNRNLGKAGRSRYIGRRPQVRGVAMNPVDHPHGGGEGKTGTKRHPVSYNSVQTKGKKTRDRNKKSARLIVKRREV